MFNSDIRIEGVFHVPFARVALVCVHLVTLNGFFSNRSKEINEIYSLEIFSSLSEILFARTCKDRLNFMSNHSTAVNRMRTGFNRLLCMSLCKPRLPNFSN